MPMGLVAELAELTAIVVALKEAANERRTTHAKVAETLDRIRLESYERVLSELIEKKKG